MVKEGRKEGRMVKDGKEGWLRKDGWMVKEGRIDG